jgi:hypothetical protein
VIKDLQEHTTDANGLNMFLSFLRATTSLTSEEGKPDSELLSRAQILEDESISKAALKFALSQ